MKTKRRWGFLVAAAVLLAVNIAFKLWIAPLAGDPVWLGLSAAGWVQYLTAVPFCCTVCVALGINERGMVPGAAAGVVVYIALDAACGGGLVVQRGLAAIAGAILLWLVARVWLAPASEKHKA